MRHIAKLSGVFAALAITTAPVYSRDQSKVLDEIATFAERVCQTTPVKSKTEELQLSGKANAEFKGLLSKLAALGVGGAATYNKAESEGVLQKDLAGLLGKSTDCRQKITEKLIDKLLTSRSLDKTDSKIVNAPEKTTSQLTSPSIVVLSDFNAYEMQRRTLGNSYQFFKINGPLRYRTWLSEAEHGNAMAQVLVGRALDVGAGVIEDKVELAKWFQRAADQGNSAGQFNLGALYEQGRGVVEDQAIALTFYEQAAKQNHPGAISALGDIQKTGRAGSIPNITKALELYQQAISLGDTGAMAEVAYLYLYGTASFPADTEKAIQLYKQAASIGNETAKGMLIANKLADLLKTYSAAGMEPSARKPFLEKIKLVAGSIDNVDVSGLIYAFNEYEANLSIEKILRADASDPMREILSNALDGVVRKFRASDHKTKKIYLRDFSKIVSTYIRNLVNEKRYGDVAEMCRDIYKGVDISKQTNGDQARAVELLTSCSKSLFITGHRADTTKLASNAVTMIDTILSERPWDWFLAETATELYWSVGASLLEMNEPEKSKEYLSRAWHLVFNRLGRRDLIGKYEMLPVLGELPRDVTDEDRKFFNQGFTHGTQDEQKRGRYTKFTIPSVVNGEKFPFDVYIISGSHGYQGLQDQFVWLRNYYNGQIPSELHSTFYTFYKTSIEKNIDFRDLCVYALGTDSSNGEAASKSVNVSKFDDLFKDEYANILLQGKNQSGNDIYSYVKVTLPNIKRFYSALNSGEDFNSGDFGTILAEGEGTPSDELRAEMASKDKNFRPIAPKTFGPKNSPTTK